jgi:hypothetical protein
VTRRQTVLADWVQVFEHPQFWDRLALTFCAWTRADPDLPRALRGTDTRWVKLRLAALLELAAREGHSSAVVVRTRDLHDYARSLGMPVLSLDTYQHLLGILTAALRDHGVPRDIVEAYRAVFADIGPCVVGHWEQGLHPYLRASLGTRRLRDSAALADYARHTLQPAT